MPGSVKRDNQLERLQVMRLRYSINSHLNDQGITTPAQVSAANGLTSAEAARLLARRQWREGDVAALKAIAAQLGLEVSLEGLDPDAEPSRGR